MAVFDRGRRSFLGGTALAGLGVALGAGTARAFTRQKMNVPVHKAWLNACSGADNPYHAQLVARAEAELKGRMSEAGIQQAIASMHCPICGCPLAASATPAQAPAPAASAKAG